MENCIRFASKTTIIQITAGLEQFNAKHCLNVLTMKQKLGAIAKCLK